MGQRPALGLGDAGLARRLAAPRMDCGGEGGDASPGSPFPALSSTMRPDPRHKHAPRHPEAPLPPFGERKIKYGSVAVGKWVWGEGCSSGAACPPRRSPPRRPRRAAAAAPRPEPTAAEEGAAHTRAHTHTHTQMAREEGESFQPL